LALPLQVLGGLSPKLVRIGQGIELHYVESGSGRPVIFVHGSLSDYSYWQSQMEPFGSHYRAIAFSRRYNFPNQNPVRAGYSASVDADDLAALIQTLGLGKAVVTGHSYGALTALFLAIRHPKLVRALVLAEAPAVSLLNHLSDERAATGKAMFTDIETRMVNVIENLLNERDVARITGLSVASVRRWRLFRQGPKFLKINSAVRYRPEDISAWLASRPTGGGQSAEALR
jgi:pimeloyl-ACP methyl ester carboxylesterase